MSSRRAQGGRGDGGGDPQPPAPAVDLATMAQAIAQAFVQAGVGQQQQQQPAPPQAQVAIFAKTPYGVQAQAGAFVNYSETSGRKLFEAATKKLKETLHDYHAF